MFVLIEPDELHAVVPEVLAVIDLRPFSEVVPLKHCEVVSPDCAGENQGAGNMSSIASPLTNPLSRRDEPRVVASVEQRGRTRRRTELVRSAQ